MSKINVFWDAELAVSARAVAASDLNGRRPTVGGYEVCLPTYPPDYRPERWESVGVSLIAVGIESPATRDEAMQITRGAEMFLRRFAARLTAWLRPLPGAAHGSVIGPIRGVRVVNPPSDEVVQWFTGDARVEIRWERNIGEASVPVLVAAESDERIAVLLGIRAELIWGSLGRSLNEAWRALELTFGARGELKLLASKAAEFARNLANAVPGETWSAAEADWASALDLRSRFDHADEFPRIRGGNPLAAGSELSKQEWEKAFALSNLALRAVDSYLTVHVPGYVAAGTAPLPQ